MSGQKTRMGVLVLLLMLRAMTVCRWKSLPSLAELAEARGLKTGIVSTARITHATPAGSYAHAANRNWEDSASLPQRPRLLAARHCTAITDTPHGDGPDVILGGGERTLPASVVDPEHTEKPASAMMT